MAKAVALRGHQITAEWLMRVYSTGLEGQQLNSSSIEMEAFNWERRHHCKSNPEEHQEFTTTHAVSYESQNSAYCHTS